MKKILMAVGALAVAFGISSCQGGTSSSKGQDSFGDSIAVTFGEMQGNNLAKQIDQYMPEDQKAKFNKDGFLRGMKQALMADTADMGYVMGLQQGLQLFQAVSSWEQQGGVSVSREALYSAFATAFKNPGTDEQDAALAATMQELFNQLQTRMQENMMQKQAAQAEASKAEAAENEAAGTKYVDELKAKDKDIKTTEDGLSYKVIKQGTGALPTGSDKVNVIYTGKLINGTEFDSSKGKPVEFSLEGVIPGFREGLEMMNPGSKYILYIPASLGYGDREMGTIPPGSTLVFEVEVVDFVK